ncbi:TPA: ATP-dependent endonuclease [Klebsiella michiganensis]|uniref:ATP-dependent endonuclease n=1 Tax=Klebsiella michiganensis TaxID=1134687 RepID=UPI000C9A084A|nr:ATP-dependent endonuclease [Klebsiella michiganensis]ELS4491937.1 ATP-dependent endonuclease [Klebsiella michiganensis]ELS4624934.1 ATP-dependent endonuclease [Klebsiella michiganensis]MBL6029907.1 ATP-dependent endonuclease [Klebsiella michiganensis]MCK2100854.1 ATP-dependent endonuclease [Klebsiella michiganensis]MDQ4326596.1 ATP-dependent endonuclease [Klebsiella michiganensis]
MHLERVEIVGFRGINRLSLMLEQNNVLIGENAWGKSSLLDALTLLLSPEFDLYHFVREDFWFPPGDIQGREHHLHIILTFRENEPGRHRVRRYRPLSSCWVPCDDGYQRVFYRLEGELADDDSVMTLRSFIDGEGKALELDDIDELARHLVRLMPVLRLRDARFMRRIHNGTVPHSPQIEITARQLDFLSRELVHHPQNLTDGQIRQGLSAMVQLLEHYFAEQSSAQSRHRLMRRHSHDEQRSWRYLDIINRMIDKPGGRSHRVILLGLFSTLLQAKGTVRLDRDARPLLLIEDPETRLHPIMLSVAWHLLNLLPLQRVTTTNSGELLSLTPVEHVCRLVRESSRVSAWRLGPGGMNAEDSRRIAFHIRFNRASSLFARCWLLVEGETETWVINELARQCGHHFDAEGVKVIEFAQSGLKPLIKFARRMGIEWHVLVDGDEAGKKYSATVRSLLNDDKMLERDHLTALPAMDMEHFMYRQGFDDVYHRVAQLPMNIPMNMRRVITKAIHRSSKPDLAIEVAMEAGRRGVDAIPTLLKKMFSRVLWLARGRAD